MIKAIFFDFDGTFYTHTDERVLESTKLAMKKLKENGILTFVCSGRSKIELTWFDMGGCEFDGYVLNNGGVCYDKDFNLVYANPITGKLKEKLVALYNEKRLPVMFSGYDGVYCNMSNEHIVKVQQDVGSKVPTIKEYADEPIIMTAVYFTDDKDRDDMMALKNIAEVTYWHDGAVDIVPLGSSKKTGIDNIIKHYGVKIEETMGIGDGQNDMEMIKHCGIGIAMGNSEQEVKDIADYVTDHIDNDGLYNALKHYNLV